MGGKAKRKENAQGGGERFGLGASWVEEAEGSSEGALLQIARGCAGGRLSRCGHPRSAGRRLGQTLRVPLSIRAGRAGGDNGYCAKASGAWPARGRGEEEGEGLKGRVKNGDMECVWGWGEV